jgi:PIN domain nuclease of toxin-antitoxin system
LISARLDDPSRSRASGAPGGDPFDRILVAQAQLEGLTIVTRDPKIARYQVAILPA